jgi:hypothetical protein
MAYPGKIMALAMAAILFLSCSIDHSGVAGGSSQTGNPNCLGKIIKLDGTTPACSVFVELTLPLPTPDPRALPKRSGRDSSFVRSMWTDNNGHFEFDSIPEGFYILTARDGDYNWMRDSIVIINDSDYVPSSYTLQPAAGIQLTLPRFNDTAKGSIRIVGPEILKEIDTGGTLLLKQLTAGNFYLQLKIFKGNDTSYYGDSFTVKAGEIATIKFEQLTALYRVMYNGNGNTSGAAPMDKKLYEKGEKVILRDSGDLAKEGAGFRGWNTKADASGAFYKTGDALFMDTFNVALYAQWEVDKYLLALTSSGNGKISGPDSVVLPSGTPYTIAAIPDPGYHFAAWRVLSGNAKIADSLTDTTAVILGNGNAAIRGVFKSGYTFQKEYGDSSDEKAYSIQTTKDGGYIIVGSYVPFHFDQGPSGIYVMKTNASGNILWTKIFGNGYQANSIRSTFDGNFIIVGNTRLSAGGIDIFLMKIDENGNQIWIQTLGGPYDDVGSSVQQTNDGGYIITGSTQESICLIKTDANGDITWNKIYRDSTYNCAGISVQQTIDGGYFLTADGAGAYIIKTDAHGDTIWTKELGEFCGAAFSGQQTSDGGYIITGKNNREGLSGGPFLAKVDSTGNILWIKDEKREGNRNGCGYCVKETNDGGYIITGTIESEWADVYNLICLIKTDVNGQILWTKEFGGSGFWSIGYSVQQTSDGGFVIIGEKDIYYPREGNWSDIFLIKTDEIGNTH